MSCLYQSPCIHLPFRGLKSYHMIKSYLFFLLRRFSLPSSLFLIFRISSNFTEFPNFCRSLSSFLSWLFLQFHFLFYISIAKILNIMRSLKKIVLLSIFPFCFVLFFFLHVCLFPFLWGRGPPAKNNSWGGGGFSLFLSGKYLFSSLLPLFIYLFSTLCVIKTCGCMTGALVWFLLC